LADGESILDYAGRIEADERIIDLLKNAGARFSYQSELLGSWLNPGMNGVPGGTAKMIFHPDGNGSVFDTVDEKAPMATFTYEFANKNETTRFYQVISTYSPDNRWYSLIQIVDNSGLKMMFWGAFGQNVEQFPKNWNENPPFVWQGVLSTDE
jgi:hypothetical protein